MSAKNPLDPYVIDRAMSVGVKFHATILALSALLFVIATVLCWQDKSWGALWIAFVAGPAVILGLMLLGLIAAVVIHLRHPEVRYVYMIPALLSYPPFAAAGTIAVTLMMELHGC